MTTKKEDQVDIHELMLNLRELRTPEDIGRLLNALFEDFSLKQVNRLILKAMWLGGHGRFEEARTRLRNDPYYDIDDWIAAQPLRPWDVKNKTASGRRKAMLLELSASKVGRHISKGSKRMGASRRERIAS